MYTYHRIQSPTATPFPHVAQAGETPVGAWSGSDADWLGPAPSARCLFCGGRVYATRPNEACCLGCGANVVFLRDEIPQGETVHRLSSDSTSVVRRQGGLVMVLEVRDGVPPHDRNGASFWDSQTGLLLSPA